MNKKALIFFPSMALIVVIVLTSAFFVLSEKKASMPSYVIGERQFTLLSAFYKSEDTSGSVEVLARSSAIDTLFELAANAGFYKDPSCGKYMGYPLLNTNKKSVDECFPDYQSNFKQLLKEKLGGAMSRNSLTPVNFQISLIEENETLIVKGESYDLYEIKISIDDIKITKFEGQE